MFRDTKEFKKIVDRASDALLTQSSKQQFLSFAHVSQQDLTQLDASRHKIGRHLRMTYYNHYDVLIVKLMPGLLHENPFWDFSRFMDLKMTRMKVTPFDLYGMGAVRMNGNNSSKEADAAFKPIPIRSSGDSWPSIVLECGLSESLRHLRMNAHWWFTHSNGDVRIVLLFSVLSSSQELVIEKWELIQASRPVTRASSSNPSFAIVPACVKTVQITSTMITGAPLVLEFDKVFLRPPTNAEEDFIFTTQEFREWADRFWANV